LKYINTSTGEVELGALHAYMHLAEMFNRSDPQEFANSLEILDKDLAERFSRCIRKGGWSEENSSLTAE
jgi:hypothetical protein